MTKYNPALKEHAVRIDISSGKSTPQMAKDLGGKVTTQFTWSSKAESVVEVAVDYIDDQRVLLNELADKVYIL